MCVIFREVEGRPFLIDTCSGSVQGIQDPEKVEAFDLLPNEKALVRLSFLLETIPLGPEQVLLGIFPKSQPVSQEMAKETLGWLREEVNQKVGVTLLAASAGQRSMGMLGEITVGNLKINPSDGELWVKGMGVHMPRAEFFLLGRLAAVSPRVDTVVSLAKSTTGHSLSQAEAANIVKVYVRRIKNKLEEAGANVTIANVRGFGYRLVECSQPH